MSIWKEPQPWLTQIYQSSFLRTLYSLEIQEICQDFHEISIWKNYLTFIYGKREREREGEEE